MGAWGKLGQMKVMKHIREALTTEDDPEVRIELEKALMTWKEKY